MVGIQNICTDDELNEEPGPELAQLTTDLQLLENKRNKKIVLRRKIMAVAKMATYFRNLRDEQEAVLQLKGLSSHGIVPEGMLESEEIESKSKAVKSKLAKKDSVKDLDKPNERMPKSDKF